jgi:adenine C2-methylase RlmN of 23S rRNA A2503 and tRNA A37
MRVKRRDTEQWMAHRLLPENLKERIMRHEQYRWQETRGVDEEGLLTNLPKDLRREIKRHLCLSLLMKVLKLLSHIFSVSNCLVRENRYTFHEIAFIYCVHTDWMFDLLCHGQFGWADWVRA